MNYFTIIIPIYNEEENILNLLKEIELVYSKEIKFDILLYDDGSNDSTFNIISNYKSKIPIKILKNKFNKGQSYCMYYGAINSNTKTVLFIDADGQNNPKDIPSLVNIFFNKNVDLVSGIRKKRKDSFIKLISSKIANKVRQYFLKDNCEDTGCSLKIMDKTIFIETKFFDGIHRFIPAIYNYYNKKIIYLDVDHRSRIYGKSKYGTVKRMLNGIIDIFKLKYFILK